MRKVVMLVLLGFVGLVILAESGVFEALALFLLAGVVPGTDLTIPYGVMLLLFIGTAWLVLFRFVVADAVSAIRKIHRTGERKKRLPKRRFSQI